MCIFVIIIKLSITKHYLIMSTTIKSIDHSEEFPNAIRANKSTISFIPMGRKVLVKYFFEAKYLEMSNEQAIRALKPYSVVVAGYGENTYGIEIGDEVFISQAPITLERYNDPNNDITMPQKVRDFNTGKCIKDPNLTYKMEEYFIHDMNDIIGVIK